MRAPARRRQMLGMPGDAVQAPARGRSPLGEQVVRPMWDAFQTELMAKLDAVTIDDLCRDAGAKNIQPAAKAGMDFTI